MRAKSAVPEVSVKADGLATRARKARIDGDNVPIKNVMLPPETCRQTIAPFGGRTV